MVEEHMKLLMFTVKYSKIKAFFDAVVLYVLPRPLGIIEIGN